MTGHIFYPVFICNDSFDMDWTIYYFKTTYIMTKMVEFAGEDGLKLILISFHSTQLIFSSLCLLPCRFLMSDVNNWTHVSINQSFLNIDGENAS